MRTIRKSPRVLAAAAAALLVLAGCGDDPDTTSGGEQTNQSENESTTEDFNDVDVMFAQGMIPHHEQAITMSDMVLERTSDDAVRELAEQIKQAQDPEIQTMSGWLEDWPESGTDGGHDMGGMMSPDEMAELDAAQGADFDRMFLEMMIEHHEGAIEMAKTEQEDGQNAAAKELAVAIEKAQTEEIEQMRTMLE